MRKKRRSSRLSGYGSTRDIVLFLLPGMGAYAFIMLYPNIASMWYSLTKWSGYGSPQFVGLENFGRMLRDPVLLTTLGMAARSLFLALVVILPLAFFLAFLLSRKVRGRKVFRFFYFLPIVIPGSVLGIMWKHIFAYEGVLNFVLGSAGLEAIARSWLSELGVVQWTVLVPDLWSGVCFYIIIFAAALEGIPQELYDAASIDGANGWQEMIYITLPSVRAVYVTAMILALPGALSTFIYPFVMTNGGPVRKTYTIALWMFSKVYSVPGSSQVPQIGYGSAIALLHAALGVGLSLLVWRFGRRDVTAE
jgi:raffinose/stachyose/melibiose transport system permease protein